MALDTQQSGRPKYMREDVLSEGTVCQFLCLFDRRDKNIGTNTRNMHPTSAPMALAGRSKTLGETARTAMAATRSNTEEATKRENSLGKPSGEKIACSTNSPRQAAIVQNSIFSGSFVTKADTATSTAANGTICQTLAKHGNTRVRIIPGG